MRQKKSKGGRPLLGAERRKRYNVMLEPRTAATLRRLGAGNLSRGIALAIGRISG